MEIFLNTPLYMNFGKASYMLPETNPLVPYLSAIA